MVVDMDKTQNKDFTAIINNKIWEKKTHKGSPALLMDLLDSIFAIWVMT